MSDESEDQSSHFHVTNFEERQIDSKDAASFMRSMHGPQAVDQAIRGAVSMCWMMLPADRKNVAAVEAEIRRLVDRALANFREDAKAFGAAETP